MASDPCSGTERRRARHAADRGTTEQQLLLELIADPAASSIVRQRLRRWLDESGWPTDDADDVVMAVHEAVANVIDHAYCDDRPGSVRITGRMAFLAGHTRAEVELVVRDLGRWKPLPSDPGYGGYGLRMIYACMHTVEILTPTDGTEVRMVSNVAPLSLPLLQRPSTENTVSIPVSLRAAPVAVPLDELLARQRSATEHARYLCGRAAEARHKSELLAHRAHPQVGYTRDP